MQNLDGSLGFKATLDIDDFNVSSEALERKIKKVANNVENESDNMADALLSFAKSGANYIVSYLVGQGMGSLLKSIVQTRGQFQQLQIAFETMLGSGTKAKMLMDQLVDTAARTPFDLMGVAGGAKQLLAYGESADKVNDTLVRLGNIASGLSIPLQDIVYLYGTTMVQGRLYAQDVRQFTGRGIPLVKELAAMYGVTAEEINNMVSEGKIGFPEVEKVILKLTNSGGQFYNLMEKQSASLTGQMANLGEAWDSALNKLGTDNQDLFSGAISGATYLVENLDEILRIVKAITIAYGSYKAAIVLNTLVTKGYTGVALLDNTARQAKIALLKLETVATQGVTVATKALWATMKANPLGWIVSILGAILSVFTLLGKKEEEITGEQIGLANATKKAGEEFATQASKVDALQKILNDSNQTYSERIKALKELKEIVPGYNAELTQEGEIINNNTKAIQEYLTKLEKQIKLKAAQEELEAAYREKRLKEKEIIQKQSAYDTASAQVPDVAYGDAGANYQLYMIKQAGKAEKALKKAQGELTGINKTIEELNNEINTTSLSLDNSTGTTKTYAEQVQDTKMQIASLTKELEALRSGKIKKDNLALAIEEKTKDLNTAKKNLELLTGEKNDTVSTGDQYNRKRLDAEFKLEKDRISVMENGYEKRKALLDLQHKQNLAQIDKEEKELAEARKKANKGGLSQSEVSGFQERRSLEKSNYNNTLVDLFDEEIAYRKKQYELYYRWVENMGKQVADTQFATLLKDGSSYAAWINAEIAKLEQKRDQNPNAFSAGDQENLFSLTLQRDEITGKRSAMDLFKESISQTVNQASTLAAKIEAIAEAKEKLARGEFKLNPDQTLQAQTELDTMDREAQQELNQAILDDFKSYEEKKNEIIANYNAMRLTQLAQNNSELLARINKGEADALSAINAEQLKASQEWKDLFTNLDVLTASEIERLIKKIEQAMSNSDLKLSPVDYQALLDSLNGAKEKLTELNPFKALGKAFDNYIQATKKLKKAEEENLSPEQIKVLKHEIETAAKQITASIGEINQMLSSVGNSFSSLAASFGNDDLADTISGVTDVLGGAGQTAQGVGQIMSGDLLGGITSCVSGVTSVIGAFNKMHDKKNEKRIQRMQDQIDELADSYDNLGDAIARAYSTDKANMLEDQSKNLEQQNELIRKQIQEEKDKKDTDWDRIKEWEDQIAENEKQIAENAKYNIIEAIMGTEVATAIDDLATAYADAWASGEKAAGKSFNVVKSLIKTAIIEQLKNKLKPEVEKFMTYLAEAMEDGVISEAEERLLDRYEEAMESTADKYLSKNEKWLKDEEEDTQDPLTGAVRSLSEETGGVIAGKANAIVINQSEQMVIMRNQLVYQAEIAANTRASAERLANIESTLKRIENKDSSLLSQGIS